MRRIRDTFEVEIMGNFKQKALVSVDFEARIGKSLVDAKILQIYVFDKDLNIYRPLLEDLSIQQNLQLQQKAFELALDKSI
jgi:hypothetical protein